MKPIPVTDLSIDGHELEEILERIETVLRRGWFVLGPEVSAFEHELAISVAARHAVGVGNGTDALALSLQALDIGSGDDVIVPAFTAFPTVAAVISVGANPVVVDVERDLPLLALDQAIGAVTARTKAVIVVHLYGICANIEEFGRVMAEKGVAVIEDCAQAQGATLPSGGPAGSAGVVGAFSFYPTKNLGGVGDGGAVVTDREDIAAEIRSLRSHGEKGTRYVHETAARNSRLDDVQAAVLRYRLNKLEESLARRRAISSRYAEELPDQLGYVAHTAGDAPHLAVLRTQDRDGLAEHLQRREIATGRHYPIAVLDQPALKMPQMSAAPHAAQWAKECLSLPLHSKLSEDDVSHVIRSVAAWPG